ncbi:MAG: hypothetical protein N2Z20_05015, partial [Elusimicrobiales bacterium]|nr:hypothetical protein [Elusimicrobiales bacterium]
KKLVPKFSDIRPYIISSFSIAKKYNIKILSDGIPLCFMKGFEDFSVSRLYPKLDTKEKIKILICKKCKKYKICDGIRKDYLEIYGNNEFQDNYY